MILFHLIDKQKSYRPNLERLILINSQTFATAPKKHNENVIGDTDVKDKVLAKHLRDAGNSAFW